MKITGIRILDGKDNILSPTLSDLLQEIINADSFSWAILFLSGTPNPGQGSFLTNYENKINNSKNGLPINWRDLNGLSIKFSQMFETVILGCRDSSLLKRYEEEKEMYLNCDIAIQLVDCAFWEVFSKDPSLINRLSKKFKTTQLLTINNFNQ